MRVTNTKVTMGRIAGIDFGTVRIGVALSDIMKVVASPQTILPGNKDLKKVAETIIAFCEKNQVEKIVLGLPLKMSGQDSSITEEVRKLEALLKEMSPIPVLLWDERLTSAQVEKALKEQEISRKKRTPLVDSLAAALILQSYLDSTGSSYFQS